MRGESSDVIEGKGVEDSGGHSGKSNTATHSPPLSAAASQVSLATSDLTTSDPDLALESSASSFTSSRPPSSSDVISPDLGLPNVDDDRTQIVISPDLGVHNVDDDRTENVISPDLGLSNVDLDDRTEIVISPDLGVHSVDEDRTETVISSDLGSYNVDDDRTEIVISPDLGLPNVDDYTTETDTLTTQSNHPVRSVMAGGGSSFMNELNAALRKHSHANNPDLDKPDEASDKTDDTSDKISDKIGYDHRVPPSSLPIYPGAISDANSLSLEGKPQGVKLKKDGEKLPELDFEAEVGMVVLSHQAAKHKLSVKPKRKYEIHRHRKRFQEHDRIILDPSVSDSNSQNLQERNIASPVMPTSLPSSISPQNRIVDCPESPLPQTEEGLKKSGVCFAPDIKVFSTESIETKVIKDEFTEEIADENSENTSDFRTGTRLLGVPPEDGPPSLGPPSGPTSLGFDVEMEDEDYFEEFHLPNTYDNAFVRHKSFRRKVNLAPIDAPDAERIEGLIVAGEFERHGSIRRKLVPEVIPDENNRKLSDISSNSENDSLSTDISGVFGRDLEEIQEMLNEENNDNLDDIVPINNIDSINHNNKHSDKDISNDAYEDSEIQDSSELNENTEIQIKVPKRPIKRTNTSTPKSNSTSSYTSAMIDKDLSSMSEGETTDIKGEPFLSFEEENMSIEHSTLVKIQECRDFSKLNDIYSLTGKIQDILSPEEMKAVIENADLYRKYIPQDIIDVLHQSLSLSIEEQTTETNTIDSGISSPKRTTTEIKSDLRSVFEGSNESFDVENENESKESGHEVNENESQENINDDEDLDSVFVFERKRSLRIVKTNSDDETDEVEVEAVFVESNNSPRNMKRLTAPTMDFSTGSEDFDGSNDISVFSNEPPISDLDTPYLPNIVLTNTDGYRGELNSVKQANDSCADILLYDTPGAASEVLTPFNLGAHSFALTPDPDPERPASTDSNGSGGRRKIICVAKDILNSPNEDDNISISSMCSEGFSHEDTIGSIGDEILGISDKVGINSPRRSHGSDGYTHSSPESQSFEEPPLPPSPYKTKGDGEDAIPSLPPFIPELTAMEESMEDRHWRSVVVGGAWRRIDMNVIAPYRKCLHHGGYMSENNQAIIVFSSCYLPSSSRRDYNYVMDNLFLYVLSTLEQLIADDYVLIYLAGGCPKNSVPSFKWLKRAYQMIDHKLRKNLQALHVVHPTMWVKTIVTLTRPFVSSKFYRKLSFINNLTELAQVVPLDQLEIPDTVQQADFELMIIEKKRNLGRRQGGYFTSPRKIPHSPSPSISVMSPTRDVWSPVR